MDLRLRRATPLNPFRLGSFKLPLRYGRPLAPINSIPVQSHLLGTTSRLLSKEPPLWREPLWRDVFDKHLDTYNMAKTRPPLLVPERWQKPANEKKADKYKRMKAIREEKREKSRPGQPDDALSKSRAAAKADLAAARKKAREERKRARRLERMARQDAAHDKSQDKSQASDVLGDYIALDDKDGDHAPAAARDLQQDNDMALDLDKLSEEDLDDLDALDDDGPSDSELGDGELSDDELSDSGLEMLNAALAQRSIKKAKRDLIPLTPAQLKALPKPEKKRYIREARNIRRKENYERKVVLLRERKKTVVTALQLRAAKMIADGALVPDKDIGPFFREALVARAAQTGQDVKTVKATLRFKSGSTPPEQVGLGTSPLAHPHLPLTHEMNRDERRNIILGHKEKRRIQKKLGIPEGSTEPNDEVDQAMEKWMRDRTTKTLRRKSSQQSKAIKARERFKNKLVRKKHEKELTQQVRKEIGGDTRSNASRQAVKAAIKEYHGGQKRPVSEREVGW